MRKSYGNTWWGKQWLNALKYIDYSSRLPRGKTYANKGMVQDVNITGNQISATVKGSRRTPYRVNFSIPEFTPAQKAKIISIITENPLYLSQLLNRVLPPKLDEDCKGHRINIFPGSWKDMRGGCSCPDWAVPCKHMAAVLFLVANEIDKNPFVVLQMRGFDLFKALEGVGYGIGSGAEVDILELEDITQDYSYREAGQEWDAETFSKVDLSNIPDCKENLLTILSAKPTFYPNGDFKALLEKAYTRVAKGIAKEDKLRMKAEPAADSVMDKTENIEIILGDNLHFLQASLRNGKGRTVKEFKESDVFINWLDAITFEQAEHYAPALKGLLLAYHFARKLALHSAMIPQLFRVGARYYQVRWIPALLNHEIRENCSMIRQFLPDNIIFYKKGKEILEPTDEDAMNALLSLFLSHSVNLYHGLGYSEITHSVNDMFFGSNVAMFSTFETRQYPSSIQLWLNRFFISEKSHTPVLQVLEQEEGFDIKVGIEDKNKPLDAPVPLADILAKSVYKNVRIPVLRDMALLAGYFPQIEQFVASGGKKRLFFNSREFVSILFKIIPVIRLFGIKILLPKSLQKIIRPQLSMSLDVSEDGKLQKSSVVNLDNMLNFQWKIALGGQQLSKEEFLMMVKRYSGIVKLNDEYVYFDEKEIQKLIQQLDDPSPIDAQDLFKVALTEEYEGAKVELDNKLKQWMRRLLDVEKVEVPRGLKATLRPYQLRGFGWLYKNAQLGFGSIIADDMGLGKTLQIITTLLKMKEEKMLDKKKALIVVPTTLISNWGKEIKKFAPSLNAHIYHGPTRQLEPLAEADALITSYGVARSDVAQLQKQKWHALIIDEAQNIKNPSTKQTKAVKRIKAPVKIAMSGTPVENRLSEYWSIFDFTNKSYLGTLAKFKDKYAKPIELDRDQEQMDRFMKITSPFILRRLKSDKNIIKDLPEKIEKDQYCELTKEQAAVYQNVIDTTMKTIEDAEGIARKGLVLKLISALKQICNHPKQFLKKGSDDSVLSGKSRMLMDLLEQILDNGEKTLIFTQYQTMGNLIVKMIEEAYGFSPPFLHGGVSRKQRDEMVEDFQNNRTTRILLLSLKAGGTGLNLTAANNVIHYDLWWNPAVEAQATDRAYRIGQQKNVMVHRFITKGTFEEKINQMIISKKELADLTVSTGEKWIGDFSNEELKDLVALG